MITLFWPAIQVGVVELDSARAQHARVRRASVGDPVRLVDGVGRVATGIVRSLEKGGLTVEIERAQRQPPPSALAVLVPVGDRDRMLLAAEKCVELQITSWRPVYFARSHSVSPRGEGEKFLGKVRARMEAALEQSANAWLPELHTEQEFSDVVESLGPSDVVLDASGRALDAGEWAATTSFAVGPEGGLEDNEITAARNRGCRVASLGASTLRFETAIIACAAIVRAAQLRTRSD